MESGLGSIVTQFDPRLAALLGWLILATKTAVDWIKTVWALPRWAPPALAFGVGLALILILMVAGGIEMTGQLLAQAVLMAFLLALVAIGATVLQARTRPTETARTTGLYPVVHRECGRVAMLTTAPNQDGELIESDEIRHLDGSPFVAGERPLCGTCGVLVAEARVDQGVWTARTATQEA